MVAAAPSNFNLTARLNIQREIQNLRPVVNAIRKEIDRVSTVKLRVDSRALTEAKISRQLIDISRQATRTQSSIVKLGKETARTRHEFNTFGQAIGLATRRFAAFTVGAGALFKTAQAIRNGIQTFRKYEEELAKTAQITSSTLSATRSLGDEVRKNAKKFGISSSELLQSSNELLQAGVPIQKLTQSLSLLSKLRLNSQIDDLADVSQAFIVLDRVFGQTAQQIESSFGKITQVSKRYASEANDIIRSVSVLGSTFAQAGGTINELISTVSAVRDRTRLPAAQIANGLKTIFTRISAQPDIIRDLKELGVSLEDAEGKFIGPLSAIREIDRVLGALPDTSLKKLEALQKLSGTRQVNIGAALFQSLPTNLQILNEIQRANNSISEDAAITQQTLANSITRTKESFFDLFSTIARDSSFSAFTKQTIDLTSGLLNLSKTATPLTPLLLAAGAGALASRFRFQPLASPRSPIVNRPVASTAFVRLGGTQPTGFGGARRAEGLQSPQAIRIAAQAQAELARVNTLRVSAEKRIAGVLNAQGGLLQRGFNRLQIASIRAATALETRIPRGVNAFRATAAAVRGLGTGKAVGLAAGAAIIGSEVAGSGPTSQAVSAAASSGLLLGALGLHPFAAAISGVTIGLLRLGSALEESRNLAEERNAAEINTRVSSALKGTGSAVSPISLREFSSLFQSIEQQRNRALERPGVFQSITTQFSNLFKGRISRFGDVRDELAAQRRDAFVNRNIAVEDSLIQLRNGIVANVKTFDEFKKFGGGIGQTVLEAADTLDDAVSNNSSTLAESTKALIEQKQRLNDVNDSLAKVSTGAANAALNIDRISSGVTLPKRLINPLSPQSALPQFDLASLGSKEFAATAGRLPIAQQDKELLNQVNTTTNILPQILAGKGASLTATDFRAAISKELEKAGIGRDVVAAVKGQLEKTKFEDLRQSLDDVRGATRKLLSPFDALIESARGLGSALENLAQRQLENITDVFGQRAKAVSAKRTAQLAALDVANRQRAFGNLPTQAGQANVIVQAQAQALGGSGTVEGLAANLRKLEEEFERTADARFALAINQTADALRLLTDSSTRLSGVQKRLSEVEQSRSAKLGFLESFFSEDRRGRIQLQRELAAANAVVKRGTLLGLAPQQQQLALRGLNNLGGAENAFGTRFTAQELKERLLAQAGGGFVNAEEGEIKSLQERTISTMQDAAKAQQELANFEGRLFASFVQQLGQENRAFLSGLGQVFGKEINLPPPQQLQPVAPKLGAGPVQRASKEFKPLDLPQPASNRAEILERRRAGFEASKLERSLRIPANRTDATRNRIDELRLRSQGFSDESIKQMRNLREEFFQKEGKNIEKFSEAAKSIPTSIKLEGQHQVAVNVTGLNGLDLEGAFGRFIEKKITVALGGVLPLDARLERGKV